MPRLVVPILAAAADAEFAMGVELAVQRQDQRHVLGDLQVCGRHFDRPAR